MAARVGWRFRYQSHVGESRNEEGDGGNGQHAALPLSLPGGQKRGCHLSGLGFVLMAVYRCGSGGACYSGMRWEGGKEGCDGSEMMYQGDDAHEPTRVLQNNNKAGRRMLTSCVECRGLLGVGLENQQQLIDASTFFFLGENVILMTSACRIQA